MQYLDRDIRFIVVQDICDLKIMEKAIGVIIIMGILSRIDIQMGEEDALYTK